jgi:hypothetical protein
VNATTARLALLALGLGAVAPRPAAAQTAADSTAVIATALDYIEGWADGDPERMRRALHPELVKEIREGEGRIRTSSAEELISMTGMKGPDADEAADYRDRTRLLTMYGDVAAVRIDAPQWVDLLHLVRTEEGWKILQVLWELR